MRCLNCGAEIPQNTRICPYCDMSVEESRIQRSQEDKLLQKRYAQIDNEFGFNTEYEMLPTDKLEEFLEKIEDRFEEYEKSRALTEAQTNAIAVKISQVEDALQRRYPLRKDVKSISPLVNGNSITERVTFMLNGVTPPDIASAAFIIRAGIERTLLEKYRFPYDNTKGECRFVKSYPEMFYRVIGRQDTALKCSRVRSSLNLFIHYSAENDRKLSVKLPSERDKINFILNALKLFKQNKLI